MLQITIFSTIVYYTCKCDVEEGYGGKQKSGVDRVVRGRDIDEICKKEGLKDTGLFLRDWLERHQPPC